MTQYYWDGSAPLSERQAWQRTFWGIALLVGVTILAISILLRIEYLRTYSFVFRRRPDGVIRLHYIDAHDGCGGWAIHEVA
jgi:hypothetical protein